MTQKSELGNLGENIACKYLEDKGYRIIDRNVRKPWGELDIVAQHKDGMLVFVEVKTMRVRPAGLQPEDQMGQAKIIKTKKMAQSYANHRPELISEDRGWRIDLIAIIIDGEKYDIKHYENI